MAAVPDLPPMYDTDGPCVDGADHACGCQTYGYLPGTYWMCRRDGCWTQHSHHLDDSLGHSVTCPWHPLNQRPASPPIAETLADLVARGVISK